MTATPYLTVIVPVWNGETEVPKLLEALARQTAPAQDFEVLVIDNGSTDRTAEVVAASPVARLLSEPEPGSYRARNLGLAEARGEFVMFTDADCIPDPDWIEQAIRLCRQSGGNEVFAGRIVLFQEGESGRHAAMFESLNAFNQENNARKNHCVTANWLSHRGMLIDRGGFRADLLSGGDFEFSRRLSQQGVAIRYAPDLTVRHPTRSSLKGLVAKRRRVIGGAWTLEKGNRLRAWNLIKNSTMVFAYQTRQILFKNVPMKDKPGVMCIAVAFAASGLFEVARLSAGRPPHRS